MRPIHAVTSLALALTLTITPALAVQDETDPENTAPVAENQQLETYRGVSLGGQLIAYDAEGDELTFEITTEPLKGTVTLSSDGHFVYTPKENKRGRDYFGFRATDSAGNVSQEGTVIVRLLKQKSSLTYADMAGNGAEYAAVVLTEQGVFTAEAVGTDYVFHPTDTVSRGEFLSMCMTAADCDLLRGVSSTGFSDDDAIDTWLKPYVATALLRGYITGTSSAAGAVFDPDEDITLGDACVMLNAVAGVTDVVSVGAFEGLESAESVQAVANLTACRVMLSQWDDLDGPLTRAQAAELLQKTMALLAKR
jgi:hypothetical protein